MSNTQSNPSGHRVHVARRSETSSSFVAACTEHACGEMKITMTVSAASEWAYNHTVETSK